MWCFKGREGFCVYILPNQRKSFGKSLSDIKLKEDDTISRLHAIVSVEPTDESETQYKCVINDVSKYGTFVIRDRKKEKLLADDKFVLKVGDIVQFGLKESTFTVLCHSFIIAKSSLDEEDVKKLKDIVSHLKVKLSETWENFCTHLTVPNNTLFTTKLACALASAKPIVTNAYWEAVDIAVKEFKELPEIENFLPKVKEEWLKVCSRLFLPNEKRRTLFKGLSFVHFCTKQYFAYAPLITTAGGKSCVYPTKRPLFPRDLTAKNAIVIQQPTNDSSQLTQAITADYPIIYHKLRGAKRRMISDIEIPLAILHCTTEMYCNPKYDFATFFKLKIPTFFSSDTIIEDTQDIVNTDTRQIKNKIIPETCESQNNEISAKKIHYFDENKGKHISGNKNNIVMTQNIDNEEFKCNIIPETCESQINEKILKDCFLYKNEHKYMSGTNESNIAMKNIQDADDKKMICKMTDKIDESQNNDNISKEIYSFDESEQRYVSETSKSNILITIQNTNITKNIYSSNKSELKNISDRNRSSIENNILSSNTHQQFQIQNSCYLKKNSNIFSGKNNEQVEITLDSCEFNEEFVNNVVTEKEQQNVKLQKEILKKNKVTFVRNNQEKNMLQENEHGFHQQENMNINEKNINRKANLIVEKDNLYNDKSTIARLEHSKNAKTPQIVSIKEINNSKIYIKEKNDPFEENWAKVKLQNLLKEQKLSLICNSEKNQENQIKEDKIRTKNVKKRVFQKIEGYGYENYLSEEFTNEILRKDVPCGKKFIKMFVMKPEKILTADDFIL